MKAVVIFKIEIPKSLEQEELKKGETSAVRTKLVTEAAQALAEYTKKKQQHDSELPYESEPMNEHTLENGITVSWRAEHKS